MSKATKANAAIRRTVRWLSATALSPALIAPVLFAPAGIAPASAQHAIEADLDTPSGPLSSIISSLNLDATNVVTTSVFLGATMFALFAALVLVRDRGRTVRETEALREELADLRAANEQASALTEVDDQRLVLWRDAHAEPIILGELPAATGVPHDRSKFLGFGTWLVADSARAVDAAIDRLRSRAEGFDLSLRTVTGAFIEVQGRTSGSSAFVRFIDLTGDRAMLASLEADHRQLSATLETVQTLIQRIDSPAWVRNRHGKLSWVNAAYLRAVNVDSIDEVVAKGVELLKPEDRSRGAQVLAEAGLFHDRVGTIMDGQLRSVDVTESVAPEGTAGLAIDVTEAKDSRAALDEQRRSHAQTLNQVTSAVAHFDVARTLTAYNDAFAEMWSLPAAMLDARPTHDAIMERLRNDKSVFEPRDWPQWKEEFLAVYNGMDIFDTRMHLPDGRTVHVVATPQRGGNVTWVFENLTDKLALQGQLDTLTSMQGETLQHLAEGVAVFAGDGRLLLSNSAFGEMWSLSKDQLAPGVRIAEIAERVSDGGVDNQAWLALTSEITALRDTRVGSDRQIRLERTGPDGAELPARIYHCVVAPLPDAQTMVTFVNVTDSVNVATALTERNQALEAAELVKNDFVASMNYELRTLLTSIRGFTEVLLSEVYGPLNERQAEYMGDVHQSSGKLELIVDSMLDLASIDAGLMELNVRPTPMAPVCAAMASRFEGQLAENELRLKFDLPDGDDTQVSADPHRLRQILDQLVGNAIRYSPKGGEIRLGVEATGDHTRIIVEDDGPGIPEDFALHAFSRFSGRNTETARKGAGLGLALVSGLMKLHGGEVRLTGTSTQSGEMEDARRGTRIVCIFPDQASASPSLVDDHSNIAG